MNNADMPAIPMFSDNAEPCIVRDPETGKKAPASGLTKREMMAMHIISGIASHPDMMQANADGAHGSIGQAIAVQSVLLADYLLVELERTK